MQPHGVTEPSGQPELTAKQRAFLLLLLKGMGPVQAARQAGYAETTATHRTGTITAGIRNKLGDKLEEAGLTDKFILNRLKRAIEAVDKDAGCPNMTALRAIELAMKIRGGFELSKAEQSTAEAAREIAEAFQGVTLQAALAIMLGQEAPDFETTPPRGDLPQLH